MSTARPGTRPHPAVVARRREVARARGRRRRLIALGGLGAVVMVVALAWLVTGPLLAVDGVSVTGYDRPDRAELIAALDDAAAGGTIARPADDAMRAAAAAFPWVESIVVARDWPRSLAVRVTPAEPVAVAAYQDQAIVATASGRVLGVKDGVSGLGWIRLATPPPAAGETLPAPALAPLAFIAAADPETASRVRALQTTADGQVGGRLTSGPELRLGSTDRMAAKAAALGLMLANLSAEEEAGAAYIDLTVPENPALGPPG